MQLENVDNLLILGVHRPPFPLVSPLLTRRT